MRLNYVIIPFVTVIVAVVGSSFTSQGVSGWYRTINLPSWTPPGSVIGIVWTTIFVLSTISALILWKRSSGERRKTIFAVFLLNAALNVLWSWLFFVKHLMALAAWEAVALDLTVLALIALAWPVSRLAAGLLAPYAMWAAFAAYLTFTVSGLNP